MYQYVQDEISNPLKKLTIDFMDVANSYYHTHPYELKHMFLFLVFFFRCDMQFLRLKIPNRPLYPVPIEAGLFKGTYGSHGVEIILLEYSDDKHAIGTKITVSILLYPRNECTKGYYGLVIVTLRLSSFL